MTKCIETTTENAETIVQDICLLHNIITEKEGQSRHNYSTDQRNSGQRSNFASRGQNRSTREAYNIREALGFENFIKILGYVKEKKYIFLIFFLKDNI